MPQLYPRYDLGALAASLEVELAPALEQLQTFYDWVDERNRANTENLDLPCQRGCDACCHESVFLTPLEFFAAWREFQDNANDEKRSAVVAEGLRLYQENRALIDAMNEPPEAGEKDHFKTAQQLKFRCPLLSDEGACMVYRSRELYARLFGCSFNSAGGVYGCDLVGKHLGGKVLTLLQVDPVAERFSALPLTFKRQVYPYYIDLLYGP